MVLQLHVHKDSVGLIRFLIHRMTSKRLKTCSKSSQGHAANKSKKSTQVTSSTVHQFLLISQFLLMSLHMFTISPSLRSGLPLRTFSFSFSRRAHPLHSVSQPSANLGHEPVGHEAFGNADNTAEGDDRTTGDAEGVDTVRRECGHGCGYDCGLQIAIMTAVCVRPSC